jgi:hypothetical protein
MHRPPHLLAAVVCFLTLWLSNAGPAAAADFFANVREDRVDAVPGDGSCDVDPDLPDIDYGSFGDAHPVFRPCSLRAAVEEANRTPEPDTIFVDLNPNPAIIGPAASYALSLIGTEDPAAPERTGDLDITSEITIEGEGLALTLVNGRRLKDRIFDVHPGGKLTLIRLGLVSGRTAKGDSDPGAAPGEVSGGCLRSAGDTQLETVFLFGCRSGDDGGCMSVIGGTASIDGGLFASCRARNDGGALLVAEGADVTVKRASVASNRAASGGGFATRGVLAVANSTFTANKAKLGGALAALGAGSATIRGSTIASNRKTNLASEVGAAVTVSNSIVSGAKLGCVGPISSAGGNLESGSSCGFVNTHDQQNTDPLLGLLQFPLNSAFPSFELLPGSPAIDHGLDGPDTCTDTDALDNPRVLAREAGGVAMTDAGAIEFGATPAIEFTSEPLLTATVGVPYMYDSEAIYNRTCPLTYFLPVQPGGAAIEPDTGLVTWTPEADQVGVRRLRIRAEDVANPNFSSFQIVDIEVTAAPAP